MCKSLRMVLAAMLIACASASVTSAQTVTEVDQRLDELFGAHKQYRAFLEQLQKAIAADDRQAVAAMVDYPFETRIGGKKVRIRDKKRFVADYGKIITRKIKDAVAKQRYEDLFANWQGVMIGDGEIWFSGIGGNDTVKIIAVNN
ncbi:hypothetical protein GCM10011385_31270 [Nitratireductor aestuarii]|uniref:DUF4440 domain-containing protein n=1 Tax=Nitratireductor aestuarii TaxID=1735103 RepID=A0A916RY53_9HYPH|nr:hypothetical protein [Nitratireductor aestuarii]GGA74983.1 hypothetical protein GCM10011385_31270 [Nitratireductor aestuarii]